MELTNVFKIRDLTHIYEMVLSNQEETKLGFIFLLSSCYYMLSHFISFKMISFLFHFIFLSHIHLLITSRSKFIFNSLILIFIVSICFIGYFFSYSCLSSASCFCFILLCHKLAPGSKLPRVPYKSVQVLLPVVVISTPCRVTDNLIIFRQSKTTKYIPNTMLYFCSKIILLIHASLWLRGS